MSVPAKLIELSLAAVTDTLAARTATPGGGSAAAYAAAVGIGLASMAFRFSTGEKYAAVAGTALAASDRSAGKPYVEACAWKLSGDIPESVREIEVRPIEPPLDCDIVFSSLPSSVARETEEVFARAG